jgi:hypothetical protein
MGLLFASPAPFAASRAANRFALCQRFKSPKAASNLQFERPWDRLVPAKSVRKLIAAKGVSKKFLLLNAAKSRGPAGVRGLGRMPSPALEQSPENSALYRLLSTTELRDYSLRVFLV